jgi:hypothetical protein
MKTGLTNLAIDSIARAHVDDQHAGNPGSDTQSPESATIHH